MLERSGCSPWTSRDTGLAALSGLVLSICGVLSVRGLNAAAPQKITAGCGLMHEGIRKKQVDFGAKLIPALMARTLRPCRRTKDVSQENSSSY